MDGFAARSSHGAGSFKVLGTTSAGHDVAQIFELSDDRAVVRVTTGAMLPKGADVVYPYEDVQLVKGVRLSTSLFAPIDTA